MKQRNPHHCQNCQKRLFPNLCHDQDHDLHFRVNAESNFTKNRPILYYIATILLAIVVVVTAFPTIVSGDDILDTSKVIPSGSRSVSSISQSHREDVRIVNP